MREDESRKVSRLIMSVFKSDLASDFTIAGRQVFKEAMAAGQIQQNSENGSLFLIAEDEQQIIGVLAMKNFCHLDSLFVAKEKQRNGVARALWQEALTICKSSKGTKHFTVNASNCAIPVFERFGFRLTGETKRIKNQVYTPMTLDLA